MNSTNSVKYLRWLKCLYFSFKVVNLLPRLNLHSFEDFPSFQHNVVTLFNSVLIIIVSVVRHNEADKRANQLT